MAEADVVQTIYEGDPGLCFKEPRERGFGHAREARDFREANGLAEILVDILDDLVDAVVVGKVGGNTAGGEQAEVAGEGEVVDDGHELEDGIEAGKPFEQFDPRGDKRNRLLRENDSGQ